MTKNKKTDDFEAKASALLAPLGKGIGTTISELWRMFVQESIVKGVSSLFYAGVLFAVAYFLKEEIVYWSFVPVAVGCFFMGSVFHYVGNPKYHALQDVIEKVKGVDDESISRLASRK